MALWIDGIAASGVVKIHMPFKRNHFSYKSILFGVHYKLEKSLARTLLRTKLATLLQSIVDDLNLDDMWYNKWNIHFTSNQISQRIGHQDLSI